MIRARLDIAAGNLDAAQRWAHDHAVTATDDATFLREYDHLTLVRLQLAHHRDPGPLGGVCELLDRLRAAAEPARAGSLLEIGMLRALTHHAAGHRAQALAELARALTRAPEPEAYVRLFLDEGAPMLALLQDAAVDQDHAASDVLRRPDRRLLDAARGGPSARVGGPGTRHDGFRRAARRPAQRPRARRAAPARQRPERPRSPAGSSSPSTPCAATPSASSPNSTCTTGPPPSAAAARPACSEAAADDDHIVGHHMW